MRTVKVEIADDLDGSPGAETVEFEFRKRYEIDLSEANQAKLGAALQEFIDNARPVPARIRSFPQSRSAPVRRDPELLRAIRQWANDNGYKVSDRGRIPSLVEDAYNRREAS